MLWDLSTIVSDSLYTIARIVTASVLAWISAIVSGILLAKFKLLYRFFLPVLNFFRQISPFAWLPFAIILFGLGELPIQFVLFSAMFFPAVLMVYEVLYLFPRDVIEEAKSAGAHGFLLIRTIELPMIMPQLIDIYRISWAVGWSTVIAAEMLGVSQGLGYRLLDYRFLLAYRPMVIYILLIGCIGIISDVVIKRVRNLFIYA